MKIHNFFSAMFTKSIFRILQFALISKYTSVYDQNDYQSRNSVKFNYIKLETVS